MRKRILCVSAGCLALAGCSLTRITHHGVTSYGPAWPWQDNHKSLERLKLYITTNGIDASVAGASGSQTTSTNTLALVEAVVGAAVSGAVKAVR